MDNDSRSARSAWDSFCIVFGQANEIIRDLLGNKPMGLWLDKTIHGMIWHEGVCVVRWIIDNRDLVIRLNAVETVEEYQKLRVEIERSVEDLTRY